MDPITLSLTLANSIVVLWTKVWDATPEADKASSAGDIAKSLHNISTFLQSVQERINQSVKPQ